jgi:hypothetical protein
MMREAVLLLSVALSLCSIGKAEGFHRLLNVDRKLSFHLGRNASASQKSLMDTNSVWSFENGFFSKRQEESCPLGSEPVS